MPVTVAHPAAVIPILGRSRRMRLPLLVGSMTPDLPYYLPQALTKHSPNLHIPWIGFSLGIAVAVVACISLTLSRRLLVAGLWGRHATLVGRLLSSFELSLFGLLLGVAGSFIGIATHLIWDAITKRNGWFVEHVPALQSFVALPVIDSIEVFRLLQYLSSVLGVVVVIAFYVSCVRSTPNTSQDAEVRSNHSRGAFLVMIVVAGVFGMASAVRAVTQGGSFHKVVYESVTLFVGVFAVLYVAASARRVLHLSADS